MLIMAFEDNYKTLDRHLYFRTLYIRSVYIEGFTLVLGELNMTASVYFVIIGQNMGDAQPKLEVCGLLTTFVVKYLLHQLLSL